MKYDSVHRFKSLADARVFTEFIRKAGFNYVDCDKDGGVIYSNGKGHCLMICAFGL